MNNWENINGRSSCRANNYSDHIRRSSIDLVIRLFDLFSTDVTRLSRSGSDQSLDSGASLDDFDIASLRVDCKCPCGQIEVSHLFNPPPDCLASRHSDLNSFPEFDIKSSKDRNKVQKQMRFELIEQTQILKSEFQMLGVAVRNYAKSISGIESVLEEALLLIAQTVKTSNFDELYKQFIEGANFINYDILFYKLEILKLSDATKDNDLKKCAEAAAERYETCFKEYAQQRVVSVPTILQDTNRCTHSVYKELKIKVEEEFYRFEINRLFYFKKVVKTILKLPEHVNLRITSVREGCVEICFEMIGLPADTHLSLNNVQKQQLLANSITLLECHGQVPYCCCELLSDEVESDDLHMVFAACIQESMSR